MVKSLFLQGSDSNAINGKGNINNKRVRLNQTPRVGNRFVGVNDACFDLATLRGHALVIRVQGSLMTKCLPKANGFILTVHA